LLGIVGQPTDTYDPTLEIFSFWVASNAALVVTVCDGKDCVC
jgi:hypothetical protein